MNCFLLTPDSVDALREIRMPVVCLGEVTKEIENLISENDLVMYAFPPLFRTFAFGHGIDVYAIGQNLFSVPASKETRRCAGLDLGFTNFYSSTGIYGTKDYKLWLTQ